MVALIRLVIVAIGVGGATVAAVVSQVLPKNPDANTALMAFTIALICVQAIVCIALIIAGIWLPIHRWIDDRRASPVGRSS